MGNCSQAKDEAISLLNSDSPWRDTGIRKCGDEGWLTFGFGSLTFCVLAKEQNKWKAKARATTKNDWKPISVKIANPKTHIYGQKKTCSSYSLGHLRPSNWVVQSNLLDTWTTNNLRTSRNFFCELNFLGGKINGLIPHRQRVILFKCIQYNFICFKNFD